MKIADVLEGLLASPVSYAEKMEDIILYRFLHGIQEGFYIDVGCSHPDLSSVTKLFYLLGWRGINIDARKEMIDLYSGRRARDINLCIGISDRNGTLDFYEDQESSTVDVADARRRGLCKTGELKVATLTNVLDKLALPQDIHFLKIDVEKHEKAVLSGINFSKYRPWVLAIEATLPKTMVPCFEEWEYILTDNGYACLKSDGLNRYYGRLDKRDELTRRYLDAPVSGVLSAMQHMAVGMLKDTLDKSSAQ